MGSESPWQPGDTGVTIKFGKGYEDPWLTFRGSVEQIRAEVLAAFGMEDNPELSLAAVVVNATREAHAMYGVASGLGGRVISQSGGTRRGGWSKAAAKTESVAGGQEARNTSPQEPEKPAVSPLLAEIEACEDTTQLKRLWAQRQEAFKDPEIMAAWKAKGKALQGEGK